MSDAIRLSSITVNCADARALAGFYEGACRGPFSEDVDPTDPDA